LSLLSRVIADRGGKRKCWFFDDNPSQGRGLIADATKKMAESGLPFGMGKIA
jgi:hypothetical protein